MLFVCIFVWVNFVVVLLFFGMGWILYMYWCLRVLIFIIIIFYLNFCFLMKSAYKLVNCFD